MSTKLFAQLKANKPDKTPHNTYIASSKPIKSDLNIWSGTIKNTSDRARWRSAKECMKLGVTTGVDRSFIVDITEKNRIMAAKTTICSISPQKKE